MKKSIRIPIIPILVIALVCAAGYWLFKQHGMHGLADAELTTQKAERAEDERRLALFYRGYKNYKADHHGAEPGTVTDMIPKYLDPALLVAPTVERWQKHGVPFPTGSITYNHKTFKMSYGFLFLSAGYSKQSKRLGDMSPLIESDAEQQGIYYAVYHRRPGDDTFSDEGRAQLIGEVAAVKKIAVRLDGSVGEINESDLLARQLP